MTKWFWVKMDEDSECVPAMQSASNKDRFYPADTSGWFETEEIWEVGPPITPPTDAPQPAPEPVAWRVRIKGDDAEEWSLLPAGGGADYVGRAGYECQPLYKQPPPPAPVDREALVVVIRETVRAWCRHPSIADTSHHAIADALLAAGLRLPGAVQPDETLAWGVFEGETLLFAFGDKDSAEYYCRPANSVVRVAIRIVEDEA